VARRLKDLSGSIRNIALSVAFLTADADGVVRMEPLACTARRELKKLGKVFIERRPGLRRFVAMESSSGYAKGFVLLPNRWVVERSSNPP
jgi:hypothetical protein